jgi:hypothetical protein
MASSWEQSCHVVESQHFALSVFPIHIHKSLISYVVHIIKSYWSYNERLLHVTMPSGGNAIEVVVFTLRILFLSFSVFGRTYWQIYPARRFALFTTSPETRKQPEPQSTTDLLISQNRINICSGYSLFMQKLVFYTICISSRWETSSSVSFFQYLQFMS